MTLSKETTAIKLLKSLGFTNETKIRLYLDKLETLYGKNVRTERTVKIKSQKVVKYDYHYSTSSCYDILLAEVNLKIKAHLIEYNIKDSQLISASDLASFNFCSASYSIIKSFNIKNLSENDKTTVGINFHEEMRLIPKKEYLQLGKNNSIAAQNKIIKKIRNCRLIFSGHDSKGSYFVNKQLNYIGQPDYIFQDPNDDYFVVEEKFQYRKKNKNSLDDSKFKNFHSNHIVQLQSYLKFIKDYKIKYGILIYWFYEYVGVENSPVIHSVEYKVLNDNNFDLLFETYRNLTILLNNKTFKFINDTNPSKCAACVVNQYCSHKTDVYTTIDMPYKKKDIIFDKTWLR